MQDEQKNPFPVMVTAGGRATPIDHVLGIDVSAIDSHKTILVQTTTGAFMLHDQAARDYARMFGIVPADPPAPVAPETKKKGKA